MELGYVGVYYQVIDTLGNLSMRARWSFSDYQMSADFWVDAYYSTLTLQLSNPRGAVGEPLAQAGTPSSAVLRAYDSTDGFNFAYSVVSVSEDDGDQSVRLWVDRDFNASGSVSVTGKQFPAIGFIASSTDCRRAPIMPCRGGLHGPVRHADLGDNDFATKSIDIPSSMTRSGVQRGLLCVSAQPVRRGQQSGAGQRRHGDHR